MLRTLALFGLTVLPLLLSSAPAPADDPLKKPPGGPARVMVVNGGFEAGMQEIPDGWQRNNALPGVEYAWDRATARKGTSSWRFTKTPFSFFPIAQISQTKIVEPVPDRIKVSAWIKASKATKAVVDVQYQIGEEWQHQWVIYVGRRSPENIPADHDWKLLEGVADPPPTATRFRIALQMYGPGTVWFDEIQVETTTEARKTAGQEEKPEAAPARPEKAGPAPLQAGGDPKKQYFLHGSQTGQAAPADGYRLILVLPGGDGSAEFRPFVETIHQEALPAGYLTAQLIAPQWTDDKDRVIWPTAGLGHADARFTTEAFIRAVVDDVRKKHKIDPRHIYSLGWSSGGPPVYAASLEKDRVLTGSFVAMSVFKPDRLPELKAAQGHRYYLLHSPEDFIPIRMAEQARDSLRAAGAETELVTYGGGHGWKGNPYALIRAGITWLEARAPAKDK